MTRTAGEIIGILNSLPPERVEQVYDFALFLKNRSEENFDLSDEWSESDYQDAATASMSYVESLESTDEK